MTQTNLSPAAQLAGLRKTETKTCPIDEGGCGEARVAVIRAQAMCRKCRDKLRKRAQVVQRQEKNEDKI